VGFFTPPLKPRGPLGTFDRALAKGPSLRSG
jgi:hypothetical protein